MDNLSIHFLNDDEQLATQEAVNKLVFNNTGLMTRPNWKPLLNIWALWSGNKDIVRDNNMPIQNTKMSAKERRIFRYTWADA